MFIIPRVGSLFAADKRRNYVFLCIHHSLATSDVTIAPAISSDHLLTVSPTLVSGPQHNQAPRDDELANFVQNTDICTLCKCLDWGFLFRHKFESFVIFLSPVRPGQCLRVSN